MNRKNVLFAVSVIAIIAVLAGASFLQNDLAPGIPTPRLATITHDTQSTPASTLRPSTEVKALRGTPTQLDQLLFARSLEGSDIDGHLRADDEGNLIIELAARDFFDYFLATSSEVGVEAAIDEILRYIDSYLPEPALQQARELFSQYLRYKKFNSELQRTPISGGMDTDGYIALLRDTFVKQKSARLEIFSPEANQALFGLEDQYAQYTLENMSIQNNPDLSDSEKANLLAENRSTLPIDVQASLANQEMASINDQNVSKLLNSELDDSQVYSQLIEQGYERSKAEQILAYRQQQGSFEQRYKSYQAVRAKLHAQDIPPEELNSDLKNLRGKFFISEQEQTQAKLRDLSNTQ